MSLTTEEVDGTDIEFCLTVTAPEGNANPDTYFGLEWTDGVAYVDEETSEVNAFVINVYDTDDAGTWAYYMYHGYDGTFDDGETWTVDEENASWTCDADSGECEGYFCATRALEQADYFTLPFADGTEFVA